jgi:hypothetical protein
VVPDHVKLVDSAESMALAVLNLTVSGTPNLGPDQIIGVKVPDKASLSTSRVKFFVTDSVEKFRRFGTLFLGQTISEITHVDLKE